MGCNCKNKNKQVSKKTLTEKEPSPIITPVDDLQQLNIIENMLPDINTNPNKRIVITEFALKHLGEQLSGYCDQVCQKRLKDKISKLKKLL